MIRRVAELPRRLGAGVGGETPTGPALVWWIHPEWEDRFPWLAQGTTGRIPEDGSGDFALFRDGGSPAPEAIWGRLATGLGFGGVVHARQIHGCAVHHHTTPARGLNLAQPADGHMTSLAELLLAVTVADCVPVFLVDPVRRGVALLHAGWRGTVAGILEEGVASMQDQLGSEARDLFLHLGPAICGSCYEVGPEVHEALGREIPPGPLPVDLRGVQAERALALGLRPGKITRSSHCTLCTGSPFYSHRGGDPERQIGFLGIRPERGGDR